MIFLTAMTIGIVAGLTRSAVSIALVAVLICCAYFAALLTSGASFSAGPLVLAIAGYNFGLIDLVVGLLAYQRLRAA